MHRQRSENHDAQRQRSERKYLNLKDRWICFAEFYCFDGDLWTDEYQKKSFSTGTWLISIWYGLFVAVRPRANGCSGPDQTWFFSKGSINKRFLAWVTKAKTGSTIGFVLFARGKERKTWQDFGRLGRLRVFQTPNNSSLRKAFIYQPPTPTRPQTN